MTQEISVDRYLALLPTQFGYELDHRHVVVASFGKNRAAGPAMVITWDTTSASRQDLAERDAGYIASFLESGHDRLLIVGYGPEGDDRAHYLATSLEATVQTPFPQPSLAHVAEGGWSLNVRGRWSPPRPLPEVTAEHVLAGLAAPARSVEDLAARYAPSPTPLFDVGAHGRDLKLFDTSPSMQVEVATRILDQLTTPGPDEPSKMSTLARIITAGPVAVRDAVFLAAAATPQRVDALVRTYRGAPLPLRAPLASCAAAAAYLGDAHLPAVHALLEHADRGGRHARMTTLIEAGANDATIDRRAIYASLAAVCDNALVDADAQWEAERAKNTREAAFPAPARTMNGKADQAVPAPVHAVSSTVELER